MSPCRPTPDADRDRSGMITGCAGGVLREFSATTCRCCSAGALRQRIRPHGGLFYATAIGLKLNSELCTALTFVLGLTLRLLAVRYKWEMPKFVFTASSGKLGCPIKAWPGN